MVAYRLMPLLVFLVLDITPAGADDLAGAKTFVADLSTQAIQVMTDKGLSDTARSEKFRKLFVGSVDVPEVGQRVLARYWRTATPEQRSEFLKRFEDILVYTWAYRFKNAAGDVRLQIGDAAPGDGPDVLVNSVIVRESQDPIPVVWDIHNTGGTWHITDLIVSGTSMTITYHDEYSSVIKENGGSVAALNDALRHKVEQLVQNPEH